MPVSSWWLISKTCSCWTSKRIGRRCYAFIFQKILSGYRKFTVAFSLWLQCWEGLDFLVSLQDWPSEHGQEPPQRVKVESVESTHLVWLIRLAQFKKMSFQLATAMNIKANNLIFFPYKGRSYLKTLTFSFLL